MKGAISDLSRLLGGAALLDEPALASRTRDSWPQSFSWNEEEVLSRTPLAAALPRDETQVRAVLEWARKNGVALVPRGGGSGVVGAACGQRPFVALDLSGLSSRFEMGEDEGGPFVKAGAGILGGELERRLNARGFSLLHFPASLDVSTPGGWIAAGSYGQFSSRYGGIGRQVLGVRAAYLGGELREEDAKRHLGAEGTLAVLTEAALRVRRRPRTQEGLGLSFGSGEDALAYLRELWNSSLPRPSVMRLYGPLDALLSLSGRHASGGGLGRFLEGLALRNYRWINAIEGALARAWTAILIYEDEPGTLRAARDLRPRPRKVSLQQAARWTRSRYGWSLDRLKDYFSRGFFADTMDLWGRWEDLPLLERRVKEAVGRHAFIMSHFSHFDGSGACLYVSIAGAGGSLRERAERHRRAWRAGMDACAAVPGCRVNHHHGVGLAKLPWIGRAVDADWLESLKEAKKAADPQGLLNPGKLCP